MAGPVSRTCANGIPTLDDFSRLVINRDHNIGQLVLSGGRLKCINHHCTLENNDRSTAAENSWTRQQLYNVLVARGGGWNGAENERILQNILLGNNLDCPLPRELVKALITRRIGNVRCPDGSDAATYEKFAIEFKAFEFDFIRRDENRQDNDFVRKLTNPRNLNQRAFVIHANETQNAAGVPNAYGNSRSHSRFRTTVGLMAGNDFKWYACYRNKWFWNYRADDRARGVLNDFHAWMRLEGDTETASEFYDAFMGEYGSFTIFEDCKLMFNLILDFYVSRKRGFVGSNNGRKMRLHRKKDDLDGLFLSNPRDPKRDGVVKIKNIATNEALILYKGGEKHRELFPANKKIGGNNLCLIGGFRCIESEVEMEGDVVFSQADAREGE